jgi:L-threonylcarbamoyladenylate synthase
MTRIFHCAQDGSLSHPDFDALSGLIKSGKTFCFPTDTLYGIGCLALAPQSCKKLFEIKGRPSGKPLPIFVHSVEEARRWTHWTPTSERLAEKHWPGALTMVLEPTEEGKQLLSPGADSLALRIPNHSLLLDLLRKTGEPWATTSANMSGGEPPLNEPELLETFNGRLDAILVSEFREGAASSIVDVRGEKPLVLREGVIKI